MIITKQGIAVIENDSHLSRWIEEHETLEVAEGFISLFREFIPRRGLVCDIGACLGDHTATYSRFVGRIGSVHAFEPNPVALECLLHNMHRYGNVTVHPVALGAKEGKAGIQGNLNLGMAKITEGNDISVDTLDNQSKGWARLDFIKMDAEGYEPEILDGAKETLSRFSPVMLIEVNRPVLAQRGMTPADIYDRLSAMGYSYRPCEGHLGLDMDQIDVLCFKK
jgi:FkbM family methyltransferase